MCGRYGFYKNDEFGERFGVDLGDIDLSDNYNVAPGQTMPVIRNDENNQPVVELMKWGLVPVWAKDEKIGYKMINAKAETIFEKPSWSRPVKSKRVLVPANGFYEWKLDADGKKQPYYIQLKSKELFAFAGIWDIWHEGKDDELHSYTIITTEPNKEMAGIHNRMPVIVTKADESAWLNHDNDNDRLAIEAVLRPYHDGGLDMYEVSRDVNVVRNNDNKLIYPLNSQ